jgi:uncharacterized protein YbcV (DUF1398 family)
MFVFMCRWGSRGPVRQCLNRQFFEYFERFSEHGIFHGIIDFGENKSLIIKDKNGLLIIEWE